MPYEKSNKQIQDSAFKLKSGNTSPFKQMGSSPLKQDYVKDRHHVKYNPTGTKGKLTSAQIQDKAVDKLTTRTDLSKVQFEKKLAKITKTVDPHPKITKLTKLKNIAKPFINTSKQLAKLGGGLAGAAGATALAIPIALESFAKRSIKRKKEGKSGFNISKSKKNKGFNF